MAVVRQRGASHGGHAAARARLADRIGCRHIGQHERTVLGGVLQHVVRKVFPDGVDRRVIEDIDTAFRKIEAAFVAELLQDTADGLGRCATGTHRFGHHRRQLFSNERATLNLQASVSPAEAMQGRGDSRLPGCRHC